MVHLPAGLLDCSISYGCSEDSSEEIVQKAIQEKWIWLSLWNMHGQTISGIEDPGKKTEYIRYFDLLE